MIPRGRPLGGAGLWWNGFVLLLLFLFLSRATVPQNGAASVVTAAATRKEKWYNGKHVYDAPVSVETNYGDERDHPLRRAAQRFERERQRQRQRRGRKLFWPVSTDPSNEDGDLSDDYVAETLLDQSRYRPMRITFQASDAFANDERYSGIMPLVLELLQSTSDRWAQTLSVFPAQQLVLDRDCPCEAVRASRQDVVVPNSDLHIFVQAESDETSFICAPDERGPGALAFAGTCQMDQFYRPTGGNVFICVNTILTFIVQENRLNVLANLLDHELAHVLGFSGFFLPFFWDRTTGQPRTSNAREEDETEVECVRNDFSSEPRVMETRVPASNTVQSGRNRQGTLYYEVVTPTVQTVVRNQFHCPTLTGARLENQPTSFGACFGNHWDNRMFHSEFMNPYLGTTENFVSPLTLAYFEDSGWYLANYSMAHISPYGHGRGCQFVNGDCILEGGVVPDYGRGVFCARVNETGCGPSHRAIVKCNITNFDDNDGIPEGYSWFPEKNLGGRERHDYCPVYEIPNFDQGNLTFVRDCTQPLVDGASLEVLERYGLENSRCIERSLPASQFLDTMGRDHLRPLCLATRCNAETTMFEILVGDNDNEEANVFACREDGQRITISNGTHSQEVLCPPLAEICPELICPANCAGRGICAYQRKHPECVCFDPQDDSPSCVNSPIVPLSNFVFSESCEDNAQANFALIRPVKRRDKKCKWLTKGGKERIRLHCETLLVAANVCQKTCGNTGSSSGSEASGESSSVDSIRDMFDEDEEEEDEEQEEGDEVMVEDDARGTFPAFRVVERNCEWLSRKENRKPKFCGKDNNVVRNTCPRTCGLCKE